MLKEKLDEENIDENVKWDDKIKEKFKSDERFKNVSSKTEREKIFNEFIKEIIEEKNRHLKVSGENVKENEDEEQKFEKDFHDRKKDQELLMQILKDNIKQTNLSWFDTEKLIEKDKRYSQISLTNSDLNYVYKTFIKTLR